MRLPAGGEAFGLLKYSPRKNCPLNPLLAHFFHAKKWHFYTQINILSINYVITGIKKLQVMICFMDRISIQV